MELLTKASWSDEVTARERENLQVAYRAACEGIVLLKNDGTLPLNTKNIALFGAGASMTIKGGTGSGEVNERHSVTILEGMEDRDSTSLPKIGLPALSSTTGSSWQHTRRKRKSGSIC